MKLNSHNTILGLIVILAIYTLISKNDFSNFRNSEPNRITIMSYNLENLFDTKDDPNKNDETYLPVEIKNKNLTILKKCNQLKAKSWRQECKNLNWNQATLKSKMNRLADVILNSNKGIGPDILILQEVENLRVLEEFRNQYLKKYYPNKGILIEGPDERGIDVAILSKLKSKDTPLTHHLKFISEFGLPKERIPITRPILEASFLLPDQTPLYILGVHLPSQGTPTAARKQALEQLVQLINNKPADSLVVAGGDFNITSNEENKYTYFRNLKKSFLVSHLVGCQKCKGTNYYRPRNSWSFLDVLIFSRNLDSIQSSWILEKESIRVYNRSLYQNNKWGQPKKFEAGKFQQGVSDHWPILADIVLNSSRSKGTFK